MKKTMTSNRLTIDLTDDNKVTLERLKSNLEIPFGSIVNNVVSLFCDMPEEMQKDEIAHYKKVIKSIYKQMDNARPFERQELYEKANHYMDLLTYLNDGHRVTIDDINDTPEMTRYEMKEGYIICPDDWILLNDEVSTQSIYAIVVECRNTNMPHFLYFSNRIPQKSGDDMYKKINDLCIQKCDFFDAALKSQVEAVLDSDGNLINFDEWNTSPRIGYFPIHIQGDPSLPGDYKPPMGAMIVTRKPDMYFRKDKKS